MPINKQDLINDLLLVKETIGKTPSFRSYQEHGKFSAHTLINYFGSFNNAKQTAFAIKPKPYRISKESVIADLIVVQQKIGHVPSKSEYYSLGRYSEPCVTRHFSSWNNALLHVFGETYQDSHKPHPIICEECGAVCHKTPCQIKQSEHHFCSLSCSSKYHQKNKTTGTNCSKAEKYIRQKLDTQFPNLNVKYNNRKIIGKELDIYIPSLSIAFEINGIFHYLPIFGQKKLDKTQKSDLEKKQLCFAKNISLHVIDISSMNIFSEKQTESFYKMIEQEILRSM